MAESVKTPQIDVDSAKLTVRYFENMQKALDELGKMVQFNLAEAKKKLQHAELVNKADPNQLSIEDVNVPRETKKRDGKIQKIA